MYIQTLSLKVKSVQCFIRSFGDSMTSSNFMYRTMFLLSDSFHQNASQQSRPGSTSVKKPCEKGCQCEGPNTMFCDNGLMFPLPESRSVNPKLLMPYSSLQLSGSNDFSVKKLDLISNQSIHPLSPPPDQRVVRIESRDALLNPLGSSTPSSKIVKERPHSCEDCGKTFLLKHHLVTHARVHSGERPHICVHCGKSFAHKHCLSTHLLLHSSDRPYTCEQCNKSFTLKHHLVTHARVHNRDRPYICQECGRSFPQKRHLVTHAKFHSGERPYVCSECGESFAQQEHLVTHSRFHGGQRPFHCQDCGVSFARKFELVNHSRVHGRVPYSCAVCSKEFLQKRTLQAHSRLHTAADGTAHPYSCIHCGEAFTAKAELAAHSCGGKEKNFICRECGNGFSSREGLSLHLRLHAGDRSFVPDLCSLAAAFQQQQQQQQPNQNPLFSSAGQNNSQSRTSQHSSDQQQPADIVRQSSQNPHGNGVSTAGLPNPQGQGQGSQLGTVASPNSTIPKTFPLNLKPKPHVCRDCGRAFAQKHGLIQHNKRYANGGCEVRRFACEKCGKAFLQKNHLVLHERQHLAPQERHNSASRSQVQTQPVDVQPEHADVGQSSPISRTSVVSKTEDNLVLQYP